MFFDLKNDTEKSIFLKFETFSGKSVYVSRLIRKQI